MIKSFYYRCGSGNEMLIFVSTKIKGKILGMEKIPASKTWTIADEILIPSYEWL